MLIGIGLMVLHNRGCSNPEHAPAPPKLSLRTDQRKKLLLRKELQPRAAAGDAGGAGHSHISIYDLMKPLLYLVIWDTAYPARRL